MFDKAALAMAQDIQRRRFADTPADPAKFNPKQWHKADLIDAMRNAAQGYLPAAPTRQSIATIRDAAVRASRQEGVHFTAELFRLASEEKRLPAYWSDSNASV